MTQERFFSRDKRKFPFLRFREDSFFDIQERVFFEIHE